MVDKLCYYLDDGHYPNIPKTIFEHHFYRRYVSKIDFPENSDHLFENTFCFFIFEPFIVNELFYSFHKIWKKYLTVHTPESTLIVAGYIDYQHTNYIDLLNPPGDLQNFFLLAQPAQSNWSVPIEGIDCLQRMKQFFKGHGKTSLIAQLNKVQQSLNVAAVSAMDGETAFCEASEQLLMPILLPELEELKKRWQNYYPLFRYMPFKPMMASINNQLDEISIFFNKNQIDHKSFLQNQFDQKVRRIIQVLADIDQKYIRPEIYNEK